MHSNNFCTKYLGNRNLVYICLAIIVCVFVVNHLKIFDFKPDLNGDNVYYYALGKALASGKGYTDIMFFEETPHAHFPPGYPLFNAGILAFTDSYTALKIANGILFGLSVLLLFFLIKKISNNLLLALATCLLCSMQQAMLRYSTIVMSEMLFTFLTLAVLYLFTLIDTDRLFSKSRPRSQIVCFIGMIVCLNYIYYVRTMGTSIILAVIIYMGITCMKKATRYIKSKRTHADHALQTTNKRALGSNLIVLCIIITSFAGAKTAWDTRNKSIGVTGSDYLKDFKKKPKGETMAAFSDWTGRFQNNLTNYVRKWIPTAVIPELVEKNTKASPSDITRGVFILGIILYGLITLKSLQLLLFLYIGITMGVLMIWPEQYAGHRYFIAVIPFFIFLFLNGCLEILKAATRKIGKSKYKEVIPAGALILFIVFFMFPRYAKALKPQQNFAKHKLWNEKIAEPPFVEYIYAVNWCKTNLPENTRIACRKPELFYLFSGGRKSTSFPQYATPEELFERFKNQQISQVIIDRWFRHGYVTVYPMIQQYPKHFRPLIQIGKNTEEQLPTLVFQFSPREITPTPTEVPK